MRLVNDNEKNKRQGETTSFSAVLFYSLICAFGFSSVFMSPLSLILAYRRLPDYWPKVVGIAGALLGLVFLDIPSPALIFSFVFALFVADSIQRQTSLWRLLFFSAVLAFSLAFLGLIFFSASIDPSQLLLTWSSFVERVMDEARQNGVIKASIDSKQLQSLLLYQGPFYFISGALLSVWFSIGLAAHFQWQPESDAFSADRLRKQRLPRWYSFFVLGAWGLSLQNNESFSQFFAGLAQLGFVVLSIQGLILLSLFFAQKRWASPVRATLYSLFIFLGFYALVGLGLMSPLILIRKRSSGKTPTKILEESV